MPPSAGDGYFVAEFHPRINSYARELFLSEDTCFPDSWKKSVAKYHLPLAILSLWGEDVESLKKGLGFGARVALLCRTLWVRWDSRTWRI